MSIRTTKLAAAYIEGTIITIVVKNVKGSQLKNSDKNRRHILIYQSQAAGVSKTKNH